ncbi:MAG: hypothetical protein OXC26_01550 [Albidovulum sp.]|nr:hypothetical protein [Albidovulum sp.]
MRQNRDKIRKTTYCLTSLDRDRADSSMLLRIVRKHWHIENRIHYVRD